MSSRKPLLISPQNSVTFYLNPLPKQLIHQASEYMTGSFSRPRAIPQSPVFDGVRTGKRVRKNSTSWVAAINRSCTKALRSPACVSASLLPPGGRKGLPLQPRQSSGKNLLKKTWIMEVSPTLSTNYSLQENQELLTTNTPSALSYS